VAGVENERWMLRCRGRRERREIGYERWEI